MSAEQQLVYEAANQRRQTAIAVIAGVLLMVATIIGLLGPHAAVSEQTLNLIVEHKRAGYDIVATIIDSVAELALGATLLYLWRCAKVRADRALPIVPAIVIVGVVLAAVTGIVYIVEFVHRASEFVASGQQTYDEANRLQTSTVIELCKVLGQVAALLIAVSFILVPLQAMKVGLLPKFMGYLGPVCGVLFLIPLTVVPIVQLAWLLAIAVLLSGRWPDGLPAAWRTGRAEPWPSGAEMRARRVAEAETARETRASRKRGDHRAKVADRVAPEPASETPTAAAAPAAPKRKRKRKR